MKKKKVKISPALYATDEQMRKDIELKMMMSESDRFHNPRYERLTRCIVCKQGGDLLRKQFVPFGYRKKFSAFGYFDALCICANCLMKAIEDGDVYTVVSEKEIIEGEKG